jgi:hypothetical protein
MVVAKNGDLIEHYYDPDFVMYSDGFRQSFTDFRDSHLKIYETPITYVVEYDEQAWVEALDRVAGRIWIWLRWKTIELQRAWVLLQRSRRISSAAAWRPLSRAPWTVAGLSTPTASPARYNRSLIGSCSRRRSSSPEPGAW